MLTNLSGKVALVTGASSGIGRATAILFAKHGAKVIVADVSIKGGEETVKQIGDAGGEATFIKTDVSRASDVNNLINETVEIYGRLDFAHNNAGIEGIMASTVDCTEENWDRTIAINLKSIWLCMKYEIPAMLQHGGGAIVNTSSIAGLVGFQNLPAYSASKFGIIGLTKSAALEYAKANIRVNAICPGVINTSMVDRLIEAQPAMTKDLTAVTPARRMGKPEEIAAMVVTLCSPDASFVTGHAMVVDGGLTAQ